MAPITRTSTRARLDREDLENAHRSRSTREDTTPEPSTAPETNNTGSQSTPIRDSTNALQAPLTIAKMKPALEAELQGAVIDITPAHDQIYPTFADPRIASFVAACSLYNSTQNKWTAVAKAEQQTAEKYLYTPLKNIIKKILREFKAQAGEERWVEDTHNLRMSHIEGGQIVEERLPGGGKKEVTLKSSPDLSILGHGLHLSGGLGKPAKAGYRHCLCPVEIKTVSNYNSKTILLQAGIYARQCFIHQPYRRYVPVVVVVGSDLYLYIYDRSGVLRSTPIDIHAHPATFVRIILGVSTVGADVRFSPFDPRVRYELREAHPDIIIDTNSANHNTTYRVTGTKFSRKTIRGRGTYCVNAEGRIGGKVVTILIKEAWRTLARLPEYDLLEDIKGVKGVGQILCYEDDRSTIADFRRHIFSAFSPTHPEYVDRKFCRLVLEAYGRSICHFSSKLELLQAIHDAVAGHKYLWAKGILHRDVSVDNILLGAPGAQEGYRGVLIDFDMAVRVKNVNNKDKTRTGTRAFQSYAILKGPHWDQVPPQDHLDDLESCFYCLGWVCIKYDGTPDYKSPALLNDWEQGPADSCAHNKFAFLGNPLPSLNSYFKTKIFKDLVRSLAAICMSHVATKIARADDGDTFPPLNEVWQLTQHGQDHDKVMEIIQTAISAQNAEHEEEIHAVGTDAQYPISQEYGEFSPDPAPRTSGIDLPTMKRPNPSLNDQDERVSSKRPRTRSTGKQPSDSQPKASGSKPKTHRGSGSKRVGK